MDAAAPTERLTHRLQPDLEEEFGRDREKGLPDKRQDDFDNEFEQQWPRIASTAA
jgi:hypothetical protein